MNQDTRPVTTSVSRRFDARIQNLLSQIAIPLTTRPSAEELEHRRKVVGRIHRLRESIGLVDISVSDLVREDRGWPGEEGNG